MKNIRESKEYKSLDGYNAVGLVEGFVEAKNDKQVIAALQYLHDTKLAYSLQGFFGRLIRQAINAGIIEK